MVILKKDMYMNYSLDAQRVSRMIFTNNFIIKNPFRKQRIE